VKQHGLTTSFLTMPRDWEKREEYWEDLTFGGILWRELRQLVQTEVNRGTFFSLASDLKNWQPFVRGEHSRENQWEIASTLLELAKLAAAQPPIPDEGVGRSHFNAMKTWEWDAFCVFCGKPRPVMHTVTLTALLVDKTTETGYTAQLTLERVEIGIGEIYPSPEFHAFLNIADDFQESIKNAVAYVEGKGISFEGVDVRWSLQRPDNQRLFSVGGPSMGGALGLGLLKLMTGESP
jgi:hypothetical protein